MKKQFKKMRTRYWYCKSIKEPQRALAAFFDFMELESAQQFCANIITHADSPQQYQPKRVAQNMMKYYALQSLMAVCYNMKNNHQMHQALLQVTLSGVNEAEATVLKEGAIRSIQAAFELYSLKHWRYHLFDILNYALSKYSDRLEINLPAVYIQLKALLDAAAFINTCLKKTVS